MPLITQFNPTLAARLPKTHELLLASQLVAHDSVSRIVLHGSRGPANRPRRDSDIDLSLVVNSDDLAKSSDKEALLASVLQMTSDHWQGSVECDLAAVFDQNGCGLKCMTRESFDPMLCSNTIDCMGIFKTTHGFNGFVTGCQIDCRKMYPLMTIWTKQE